MDLCDLNPVASRHPADPLCVWTTCLARSVDASWFVRQGGLGRAASFPSSLTLRPLCSGRQGLVLWGRDKLLPVKQRQDAGAGGPGCAAARERALAAHNSRLGSWALLFQGKQSRFTFWSQSKRKTVSVETRWRKVVR